MKAIRSKKFTEAIILIKILYDESMVVVDSKTTVRFLDMQKFDLLRGFKAKVNHLRYKNDVVAFSKNGNFFATISADEKESLLYNSITKKNLAKVTRHQGDVSCVGIDPKGRYMFSCGDDGKTFATDIKSGKLAFTLPAHADTINDIAFSQNSQWVAVASYDRKIQLFNIAMMTQKYKLKAHSTAVMKIDFLDKHRLLSIDRNNRGIVWDIQTGKILHRLQGIHDTVSKIAVGSEDKFLFLGTMLGYVLVYELENYELLNKKYIKLNAAITSMIFDETKQELILGTRDGEVIFYNIYEGEKELKKLLEKKQLDSIESIVAQNPLLKYTEIYTYVATLWDKTFHRAKVYLQDNDRDKAISLFSIFNNIPSKRTIIKKTLSEYDEFEKFTNFIKNGKIALAYGLANQHLLYKESKDFKAMELKWQKTFVLAQKYVAQPNGVEKAREILAPYRGVSTKTMFIQEMFTQNKVYDRFKAVVGKKNFRMAFDLLKMHPFLKEFPEYTSIMNYSDRLYIKSKELIQNDKIDSAIAMLNILSSFIEYKDEVKKLMMSIKLKQKFTKAVEDNNLLLSYALLDSNEDLEDTDDGKRLLSEWDETLEIANDFAAIGNSKGVESSMAKYIKIESKFMVIGSTFSWCYMIQLENAIKQKKAQTVIEDGVKNYVLQFGYHDEIDSFVSIFKRYYKSSRLDLEFEPKGSMKMWNPSMIVNSILD